jgi:hypothetical protein
MIMYDTRDGQVLRVGDPGQGVHILFSTPTCPYGDDPALDVPVRIKGAWVDVSEEIRTLDGDGLVEFFSSLAGRLSSWGENPTWQSSEGQLKISAQHSVGRIILTWRICGKVAESRSGWHFETVTAHKDEREMRGFSEAFQVLFARRFERIA